MGVITTQHYSPENDKKAASVPMTTRRPPRSTPRPAADRDAPKGRRGLRRGAASRRSEEHTSELLSLMRSSVALLRFEKQNPIHPLAFQPSPPFAIAPLLSTIHHSPPSHTSSLT